MNARAMPCRSPDGRSRRTWQHGGGSEDCWRRRRSSGRAGKILGGKRAPGVGALVRRPAGARGTRPRPVRVSPPRPQRRHFWQHFRDLATAGTTILVSSHVMDEASRCDRLGLIRAGRLLAEGSASELVARAGTTDLESAFLALSEAPA